MADIDLGFAEERKDAALWLSNRYFPSKIGGRPAWLELQALPAKSALQCQICKEPMSFLCQIYAPGEEEHSFHRSIYIFICREPGCQRPNVAANLTVLRSQLPRKNDFFSEEPPAEDAEEPESEIPAKKKLCAACGCPGDYACGRCRNVNYCSINHQRALWPKHKKQCGTERVESEVPPDGLLFPEYEIVIETNVSSEATETRDDADDEAQRLRDFQNLDAQGKTGAFKDVPDAELDKYVQGAEAVDDKYFQKFKKATNNEPDQILRYKRSGEPLWITDVEKTVAQALHHIPICELCGAAREYEFQVMPQMLLRLKDERLDWGVMAVYTCSKRCALPASIGYAKEYIVKQDIISSEQ